MKNKMFKAGLLSAITIVLFTAGISIASAACTLDTLTVPAADGTYIKGNYNVLFTTTEGVGGTCSSAAAHFRLYRIYDLGHNGFQDDSWVLVRDIAPGADLVTYTINWDTLSEPGGAQADDSLYYNLRVECAGGSCTGGPLYIAGSDASRIGIDNTAPVISTAETFDNNPTNGVIDRIKVTFTESVGMNQTNTDKTGWYVTNNDGDNAYVIDTITWIDSTHMYLNLTEEATHTTSKTPQVGYDGSGTSNDLAGNEVTTTSVANATDKVAPYVVITAPLTTERVTSADTISFTSSELTAAQCSTDNIAWEACTSGVYALSDNAEFVALGEEATFTLYVKDTDGGANVGTDSEVLLVKDTVAPTVGIVFADTALKIGETSLVTITFSEAVTGFANGDITTIEGGGMSAVASDDGGITWTSTFTPTVGFEDPTNIITIDKTLLTDIAGNAGVGTTNSDNYAVDTLAPTAPTAVTFTAVGAPIVADYVNSLNTNFTGGATIVAAEATDGLATWLIGGVTFPAGAITDAAIGAGDGAVTFDAGLANNVAVQAQIASGDHVLNVELCDAAGNCTTSDAGHKDITADYVIPTITDVLPAASTSIKTPQVSYTLSEAAKAASGIIVFTRTGGTADGNPVHTCTLQGTALDSGVHTDMALTIDANRCVENFIATPLVDGTIYTATFDADDAAENPATQVSNASVLYDVTAPTGTVTVDTATIYESDLDQGVTVTYDEDMDQTSTPTLTFSATTGVWTPVDAGSWTTARIWHRHYTITDADEESVAETINSSLAEDLAGNAEGADVQATYDIDTIAPTAPTAVTFTAVGAPIVADYVNSLNTNFTGGATIIAGQATGGTAEWLIDAATFPGGAIMDVGGIAGGDVAVTFDAGLAANGDVQTHITSGAHVLNVELCDAAGNCTTSDAGHKDITADYVIPTITDVLPAASTSIKTPQVSYTLSEAAKAASGIIHFNRTGGSADAVDHICTLQGTALDIGVHTDLALAQGANGCVEDFAATSLVDGTIYTATFDSSDAAGNPATTITNTAVLYDTGAPAGTTTLGTATIYESDLIQEVTVDYSEAMDQTSTPTLTFSETTGVWTPNSAGAWTDTDTWLQSFTITDADEESVGETVISSLAEDLAGNPEAASVQDTYDIDTLAPTAPTITTFTAVGAPVVSGHVNADNTGFTQEFTSPATNFAGTAYLYVDGALFTPDVTFAVVAGNTGYTLTGDGASITDLGADGTKILTVKIIDTAGNIGAVSGDSSIHLDTVDPIIGTVALGTDEYVNAVETAAGINIIADTTGVEDGQLMTCTVSDVGLAHTVSPAAVAVSGSAVTIPTGALTTLNDGVLTAYCNVSDEAGNAAAQDTDTSTKETTIPTIAKVDSTTIAGYYNDPDTINGTVTFSENVIVTGDVTLTLETGAADGTCVIGAFSDSLTGTCTYTVADGHNSADLNVNTIAGGPITDLAGNLLVSYSIPGGQNMADLEAIVIDTLHPVVNAGTDAGIVAETFSQDATVTEINMGVYAWTAPVIPGKNPYTVTFGTAAAEDTTVSAAGWGGYTIRLTATDLAGNSTFDDASFEWRSLFVPIASYSPINGATGVAIADGTATITFNASSNIYLQDTAQVTLVDNADETSKKVTAAVSGGDGASEILNITYAGLENSHTYRINVFTGAITDSTGHLNEVGTSYFTTVAVATPAVVITAPVAGASVSGAAVAITATTNGGANTAAFYQIDGGTWIALATAWDTTAVANGIHSIRVRDTVAAVTGYSDPINAVVNNGNVPALLITTPAAGASLANTATVNAVFTNDGDTGTAFYSVNGGTWTAATTDLTADAVAVVVGANTLQVKSSNTIVGTVTWGYSPINTFTVGAVATPAVVITAPVAGASVSGAAVAITATTNGGANTAAFYQIDGGTWIALATAWDTTAVANGIHSIRVRDTVAAVTGYSDPINAVVNNYEEVAPTVSSIYPTNGTTGVSISVIPTITFSESMDTTTFDTTNIQLRKSVDDTVATSTIHIVNGDKVAWIYTDDLLDYSTAYYLYVGTGVKDVVGNILEVAYGSTSTSAFTTVEEGDANLGVTGVTAIRTWAVPGGNFTNGWKWVLSVNVPNDETKLQMKFSNWTGTGVTIGAANNIQFYSQQAVTASDQAHAIPITVAGTYSAEMTLNGDLSFEDGRQIQITVEVQVPLGSTGSYSSGYGIFTDEP